MIFIPKFYYNPNYTNPNKKNPSDICAKHNAKQKIKKNIRKKF